MPRYEAGKQLVVAAESRAALWMGALSAVVHWCRQCQGGDWNLTCLVVSLLDSSSDFNMGTRCCLLKGESVNVEVFVLTESLSAVTTPHC